MAGLLHLAPQVDTIRLSDVDSFTVGGLTPRSALKIFQQLPVAAASYIDNLIASAYESGGVGIAEIETIIVQLLNDLPAIAAAVIVEGARGDCENPAEIAAALDLPFGAQTAALIAMFNRTFTSDMPPKKFLEVVLRLRISAGNGAETPRT